VFYRIEICHEMLDQGELFFWERLVVNHLFRGHRA
jgi:hypothetical protein